MAIIRTFKLSDIYGTGKKLWYKSTNNSAIMCRIIVNPHPKCAILSEQTARMVIETFHALTYTLAKYDATNEIFFTFNLYLMFLTLFSKNSFLDFQKKMMQNMAVFSKYAYDWNECCKKWKDFIFYCSWCTLVNGLNLI